MTQKQHPIVSDNASAMSPVPTVKVLAIGSQTEKGKLPEDIASVMRYEVPATVSLYLEGKIDSWYSKIDQTGVVFLMNVSSEAEARELLTALPLGKAGMMVFDLIPLGPLNPLRSLLGK